MAFRLANRVKEGCTGSGLSNLTLSGAISGYKSFASQLQVGDKTVYTVVDGFVWETGIGTLVSENELSRDTILDSSDTSTRVNSDEEGTPVKVSLPDTPHRVGITPDATRALFKNDEGSLVDPTPFRQTIIVDSFADMKAETGLTDGETFLVKYGTVLDDGKGGLFRWDATDATAPDNVDTFRNDSSGSTGLHKRIYIDIQSLVEDGFFEVDAGSSEGGKIRVFANKKSGAANDYVDILWERASSAFRVVMRYGQSAAVNFLSFISMGDGRDAIDLHKPPTLPSRTDSTDLRVRGVSWLSGVSRLALSIATPTAAAAADYWEVPLTKGGFLTAVVNTVTALKAVDPVKFVKDGDIALLLGKAALGDIQPTYFKWSASSSATADDATVIRPSVGTAASGNGRWLVVNVSPSATFTSGDATPSIALGGFFVTAGSTAITDFDDAYEGQIFVVERGNADIVITHNASLIDCGNSNITLTTTSPRAMFQHVGGVHKYVGGAGAVVDDTAYDATTWNGDTTHSPSKNAVRDKINAMIDDTAYNATTWDGVTDVAPSKNAVRDIINTIYGGVSSSFDTLAELAAGLALKLDAVMANATWLKGRNAANSADINMWRINSSNYLEPGACIYYDNTGGFISRAGHFYIARYDNSNPSTLELLKHEFARGMIDSSHYGAYPYGVGVGYSDCIEDSAITADNQKGLLYGQQFSISPKRARNNTPYDDAAAVIIQHNGTGKATEHLYVGVSATMSGASESTGVIGMEANADNAIYATGDYSVAGLNFSRALASPNYATFGAGGAICVPTGTVVLTGRNAANSAYVELLKWTSGDVLELNGKEVLAWANWTPTISSGTGTLTSASNVAGASRWSLINNVVTFTLQVQVVTKGTGATSLICTLPVQAEKWTNFAGERTSTATPLVAHVAAGSSNLTITLAGGADPLQDGAYYAVSGSYEVNY